MSESPELILKADLDLAHNQQKMETAQMSMNRETNIPFNGIRFNCEKEQSADTRHNVNLKITLSERGHTHK